MADTMITIPVDAETARTYNTASEEDRLRIQLLLRLQLREWATGRRRTLREVMDEIGSKAQARGLTPEILDELLRDE